MDVASAAVAVLEVALHLLAQKEHGTLGTYPEYDEHFAILWNRELRLAPAAADATPSPLG